MHTNNTPQRSFSMLGAPIDCTGRTGGTELAPDALREYDLPKIIDAQDLGNLDVSIRDTVRDPSSGIIGYQDVCRTTRVIREKVRGMLEGGSIPILVGGCCTQLMGAVAGVRDHFGEIGLVYADGHLDLYDGRTSPTGEAADMPLATILGSGHKELLSQIGPGTPVRLRDTFLLGYRDYDEAKSRNSILPEDFGPDLTYLDVNKIRSERPEFIGAQISARLEKNQSPFVLHFDMDVLDQEVFPATDYLMPGGLTWSELIDLLRPLGQSPHLACVALSCYNPEKDGTGCCAWELVEGLRMILGR